MVGKLNNNYTMKYIKNPVVQFVTIVIILIGFLITGFVNIKTIPNKEIALETRIDSLESSLSRMEERLKLFSYNPSLAYNSATRTIGNTFLLSDQRQGIICYNTLISVAATILLANSGQVILQSKIAGVWTNIHVGQFTVGAGISFNSSCSVTTFGVINRGDSVRIITNNLVGTPTYSTPA